ncbi:MAG: type II toxin-antitoxin system RelB/DinJ family antitoxin [Succinivibrio sp.]|nr:type II toxin-antitoxin system RelB/DinJ family antitoxin [Succinivibrio sp.]
MMANTINYTCRIDSEVKQKGEVLFKELGMSLSTAINVFLKEAIRTGGFPFNVCLKNPNKETLTAMMESNQLLNDPNTKTYSVEDALKELKND